MLMRMLCRICNCFAEPKPSAEPDTKKRAKTKKSKGKKP